MLQETTIKHRKTPRKTRTLTAPTQARPKSSNVAVLSMSHAMRDYVKQMAAACEMSASQFIRYLVKDASNKWDGRHASQQVVNAYDFGRGLVTPKGANTADVNLSITIGLDELERLNALSKGHGCNRSQYVRMLIVNAMTLFSKDKQKVLDLFNASQPRTAKIKEDK